LGTEENSTNNRMELMAILAALAWSKGRTCEIYTDSQLCVNIFTKWAKKWEKDGWVRKGGHEIASLDIIRPTYELYKKSHATLFWIKGHNNNKGNTIADQYANAARIRGIYARQQERVQPIL
jgi:ribonuclease HI